MPIVVRGFTPLIVARFSEPKASARQAFDSESRATIWEEGRQGHDTLPRGTPKPRETDHFPD